MSVADFENTTDSDKLAEMEPVPAVSEGLLKALALLDEARRELGLKVSNDPPERRIAG